VSIGGLAILACVDSTQLGEGWTFDGCFLVLPGIEETIAVSMRLKHITVGTTEDGFNRLGCEFVNLTQLAYHHLKAYLASLKN